MTDNFIQLKKSNVLKLGIKDCDGNDTGEVLVFDLEDIELPFKYQELITKDKKNKEWLRNKMLIIDKQQDVKGKKLMSRNEERKMEALKEYFEKEIEIYNIFLGENGVQKLLNGRAVGWTIFDEIDEIIIKQIIPHLDLSITKIKNTIKEKYQKIETGNDGILQ